MFRGKGIFVIAGIVILALVVGGIVIFLRSRNTNNAGNPSGSLPPVGNLPPFGTTPPPPTAGSPIGFPSAYPVPENPAEQAAKQGTSIFTPLSSKEKQAITGFAAGAGTGQIVQAPALSPPTISGAFLQQLVQEQKSLPPELQKLYNKPGGPTEQDLMQANQKVQAQFDALIAEINQLQNTSGGGQLSPSSTEQCNKVLADAKIFMSMWGANTYSLPIDQMTGCSTQLPVGLPSL